mmetsp:Transcript_24535/g.55377  ORF Transcript_24535/g.55377 Transcript_24535/m.55377 type:complete len:108 (-) Transcript_24535:580-903(-)
MRTLASSSSPSSSPSLLSSSRASLPLSRPAAQRIVPAECPIQTSAMMRGVPVVVVEEAAPGADAGPDPVDAVAYRGELLLELRILLLGREKYRRTLIDRYVDPRAVR